MITAATYLEGERFLAAERYFTQGGTLDALIERVQQIIDEGGFRQNNPFRIQIQLRFEACVSHFENGVEEGWVSWIWRKIFGRPTKTELLQEAARITNLLQTRDISSLTPTLLFAEEKSLADIVDQIANRVFYSDLFETNKTYREEIQYQFYLRVKGAWEESRGGWTSWLCRKVARLFTTTLLDRAIGMLKRVDEACGAVVIPNPDMKGNTLVFENSAWITDQELARFTQQMPHIEHLYLRGSFRLSEEGIARAVKKLPRCMAIAYPDGRIFSAPGLAPCSLPRIFSKHTLTKPNGAGRDLNDFVVI